MHKQYSFRVADKEQRRNRRWVVSVAILLAALLASLAWLNRPVAPGQSSNSSQGAEQQSSQPEVPTPSQPKQELVDLQPTLDTWLKHNTGTFSVVVYDPTAKKTIASHAQSKQYFTASIYKLYVVYLIMQDIEKGLQDPSQPFQGGRTLQECIREAIRSSDSPCGERIASTLGYENINRRLAAFGLKNTSFPAFTTTAEDSATLLQRALDGKDIGAANTKLLRDMLRVQTYRKQGIPAQVPDGRYEVKTGLQGNGLWHDVGFLVLPDGREYVIAYFSDTGTRSTVAAKSFGKVIHDALATTPGQ